MVENPEQEAVNEEPEAPAEEPEGTGAGEPQRQAEEQQAEAEESPAEPEELEAAAEEPEAAAEEPTVAEPEEPEEALHPKEARRRRRSIHSGEARPPRGPDERQAERDARRAERARRRRAYRVKARAKAAERRAARGPAEPPAPLRRPTGRRKVRQGVVVSDRADKTITVRVDITRRHRRYEKIVRSSSTLHAHDERNEAHVGDTVRVVESRPLSRTKRWRLVEVLERAK
jgi:small subunit ribosomal protein S17